MSCYASARGSIDLNGRRVMMLVGLVDDVGARIRRCVKRVCAVTYNEVRSVVMKNARKRAKMG